MADLTVGEFVTELIMGVEEKIEAAFIPEEDRQLRLILTAAVMRAEVGDA